MSALEEKTTRSRRALALIFALIGHGVIGGCGSSAPEPAPEPTPALNTETPLSWEGVLGVRLRSVKTYNVGLGPDGPATGHQYLTLSESGDSFYWLKSDTPDTGTFRRNGDRLIIRLGSREFEGELDLEGGVLIWCGVEFELP